MQYNNYDNQNIKKNKKTKKSKINLKKILKYLLFLFLFFVILYNNFYLFSLNRSEFSKNIFNRKLYLMEDEMMEDVLYKGDIAIINTRDIEYNIDDIILFKDQSGVKLERIKEIIPSNLTTNKKVYITKADKGFYLNNFKVQEDMIIGKYTRKISNMGWFLKILRSRITTIVIIMVFVIILFLLIQIRLYRPTRGKGTDQDEISLVNQLKVILSKDKENVKQLKGRHSRKIQKEKIRKKRVKNKKNRDVNKK